MQALLRDISLIFTLAHCLIMFLMLFESKLSSKKTWLISTVFFFIAAPVNIANIYFFGLNTATLLIPVCCVIPSLILFLILAKHRDLRFLFTFCFVDTISLWILVFTKLLDVALGLPNYIVMFVSRILLISLIEFMICKFFRKTYQALQNKITKGWGIFSVTGILFYVAFLFYAFTPDSISIDYKASLPLVFLLIIMPIMYVTIYILINSQIENAEKNDLNNMLLLQVQMAQEKIASNLQYEEATKILRHDVKHHMVLLYDHIEKGNLDKAKDYIKALNETVEKSAPRYFCKNLSLNVVLSYYAALTSDKRLYLDTDICLSKELGAMEQDLVVIFSNAIQNAITHMSDNRIPGSIGVTAFENEESLLIEIKNPCNGKIRFENNMPISEKTESGHGIGTRSIVHLVKKYDGIFSFTLEENCFIFRCKLCMKHLKSI